MCLWLYFFSDIKKQNLFFENVMCKNLSIFIICSLFSGRFLKQFLIFTFKTSKDHNHFIYRKDVEAYNQSIFSFYSIKVMTVQTKIPTSLLNSIHSSLLSEFRS